MFVLRIEKYKMMKKSTIYTVIFAFVTISLFSMCKSESAPDTAEKTTPNANSGVAFNAKIDSSTVDFTSTVDLQYVSLPRLHRWIVVSKSLLKLDNQPSGYAVTDTISWSHPNGKSYMSMAHYTRTNDETTDYNMYYDKIRSSYPYSDYSYTKYNTPTGGEMHEIKLSNDQTHNYKLIIPKGKEIVSIDVTSHGDGYNQEIEKFVSQIPGLVSVH